MRTARRAGRGAPRTALLGNLGSYHRAIKTTNADAQKFFDEGLTLLYGFNHEESFKSFELAAAKDAASPMPHWGMSLALGTNINDIAPADRLKQAYTHLAEAEKRKSRRQRSGAGPGRRAGEAIRRRSDRRSNRSRTGVLGCDGRAVEEVPGRSRRRDALCREPDEPAAVAAVHEGRHAGARHRYRSSRRSKRVMKRDPNHPGANHYYIHAVEASKSPDRALPQAGRLETLVPGAGHLVHMPAHIYIRTGQYAKSAKSNADAAAVDEKYIKATGAKRPLSDDVLHPQPAVRIGGGDVRRQPRAGARRRGAHREVRGSDRRSDGDDRAVRRAGPHGARPLRTVAGDPRGQAARADAPAADRGVSLRARRRAGRDRKGRGGRGRSRRAQGRGGQDAEGRDGRARRIRRRTSPRLRSPISTARIAEAKGDTAAAIKGFTAAVALEDKLGYNEPPDWLNPERERLGAVLLKAGRYADAEKVFRADLAKNIGNPRSLYGLYRALEGQKKAAAAEAKASFDKAWAGADVTLGDDLYGTRR